MKRCFWLLATAILALTSNACTWDFSSCELGETKCSESSLLTCSSDGEWIVALHCESQQFCDTSKGCVECKSNDDCKDPTKPTCNSKMKVCQPIDAKCAKGEIKCEGNTLNRCNAALSGFNREICSGQTPYCEEPTGCVECKTDNDCSAPNPVCNSSKKTCQAATDKCGQGETKCDGNVFLKCNNPQSGFEELACESFFSTAKTKTYCDNLKGCVECRNSKDCLNAKRPTCDPDTNTCQEAAPDCVENQTKCELNVKHLCAGGEWKKDISCENGCNIAQTDCAECSGNEQTCDGNSFKTCESGEWDIANCSDSAFCDEKLGCIVCQKDARDCQGNVHRTCNEKQDGYISVTCGKNTNASQTICDAIKGCVECLNNEHCKNHQKPICNLATNACEAATVLCQNKQTLCEGNTFKTCLDGTWSDVICSGSKNFCDKDKGCVECLISNHCEKQNPKKPFCNEATNTCQEHVCNAGEAKCLNNTLTLCQADGTWGEEHQCLHGCNTEGTDCKSSNGDDI